MDFAKTRQSVADALASEVMVNSRGGKQVGLSREWGKGFDKTLLHHVHDVTQRASSALIVTHTVDKAMDGWYGLGEGSDTGNVLLPGATAMPDGDVSRLPKDAHPSHRKDISVTDQNDLISVLMSKSKGLPDLTKQEQEFTVIVNHVQRNVCALMMVVLEVMKASLESADEARTDDVAKVMSALSTVSDMYDEQKISTDPSCYNHTAKQILMQTSSIGTRAVCVVRGMFSPTLPYATFLAFSARVNNTNMASASESVAALMSDMYRDANAHQRATAGMDDMLASDAFTSKMMQEKLRALSVSNIASRTEVEVLHKAIAADHTAMITFDDGTTRDMTLAEQLIYSEWEGKRLDGVLLPHGADEFLDRSTYVPVTPATIVRMTNDASASGKLAGTSVKKQARKELDLFAIAKSTT